MNTQYNTLIFIMIAALVSGCGGQTKPGTDFKHSYEVKALSLHKSLHFTGTVQPLHESALTSPMAAVVERMNFHYGQMVNKGDVVLTLDSNELQKQYNETLTDYLKAKDSYTIAKTKFIGTEDLWGAGLLSKNNYLSEKSAVVTARVTMMQATRKITELLDKMDDSNAQNVSTLSLADFAKVKKILTAKHNLIHLKAPSAGVLLYPPKSGDDKATRVTVGTSIKSGQVIALIGDLKGISVEINVPEIDIDTLRPGMAATVSGVAFGKHQLKGQLVTVNAQASGNSNVGLPSFTAVIEVHALTAEEQPWIKVGMSAAIELSTDSNEQLVVPIAAVRREQGNSVVSVKLPNGSIEQRIITSGAAQADSVVVESGLKAGDVVVYE
ncbi:MAG: efflux RND transporter periplasmic adaptor subunit [Legionellales bacterium]